jgi:hypothetical protein
MKPKNENVIEVKIDDDRIFRRVCGKCVERI